MQVGHLGGQCLVLDAVPDHDLLELPLELLDVALLVRLLILHLLQQFLQCVL